MEKAHKVLADPRSTSQERKLAQARLELNMGYVEKDERAELRAGYDPRSKEEKIKANWEAVEAVRAATLERQKEQELDRRWAEFHKKPWWKFW
ncbi:MAG: hypothetical protein V1847_02645 [Candidatus Diapherotrites archaeon]